MPFPTPGDLPDTQTEPMSLASPELAGGFSTTVPPGKPQGMSHTMQGYPRWMSHSEEFSQNMDHWRNKWQLTPVLLPQEPHEQYEKAKKKKKPEDESPKVRRCPIFYWRRVEGNY